MTLMAVNFDEIKTHLTDELTPSKSERGKYICPLCGSGAHGPGSTAAFSVQNNKGHCFSCGFSGDIFDLVAQRDGISLSEATKNLISKYQPRERPSVESAREDFQPSGMKQAPAEQPAINHPPSTEKPQADSPLSRVEQAHAALPGSSGERYLLSRGFTPETLERFQVGYEPAHYFPGLQGQREAIIFPYGPDANYWGARTLGPHEDGCFDKARKADAGEEPVFNAEALYSGEPVFVVESQLDAMTLEQEGARAVAMGGGGWRKLERQLKQKAPAGTLILNFDCDKAGEKDFADTSAMLEAMHIPYIQGFVSGEDKDPNELLQKDPEQLRKNIRDTLSVVEELRELGDKKKQEERRLESAGGYIVDFLDKLRESKAAGAISTGFPGLDRKLDGGLYPGLYIIGAITSLGKSTLTLQIADHIAASGHDVLCFNLEMARTELMAKSISRITYELSKIDGKAGVWAKSTRDILAARRWDRFQPRDMDIMKRAVKTYRETIADHIWHYEGIGDIGYEQIRAEVQRHIAVTGRLPVVFCDYLQILASPDMRMSDKQAVDKNVLELKRLSRDMNIPVFTISSLNRDNYMNPINNAAFKESGAVEYSSDCLMGLQFEGMDYQEGETDKAREKRIRELVKEQKSKGNNGGAEKIELKVLKNRNGMSGTACTLLYYPRYNYYAEKSDFEKVDNREAGTPEEWLEESELTNKTREPI